MLREACALFEYLAHLGLERTLRRGAGRVACRGRAGGRRTRRRRTRDRRLASRRLAHSAAHHLDQAKLLAVTQRYEGEPTPKCDNLSPKWIDAWRTQSKPTYARPRMQVALGRWEADQSSLSSYVKSAHAPKDCRLSRPHECAATHVRSHSYKYTYEYMNRITCKATFSGVLAIGITYLRSHEESNEIAKLRAESHCALYVLASSSGREWAFGKGRTRRWLYIPRLWAIARSSTREKLEAHEFTSCLCQLSIRPVNQLVKLLAVLVRQSSFIATTVQSEWLNTVQANVQYTATWKLQL